jgi:hypothetical protein
MPDRRAHIGNGGLVQLFHQRADPWIRRHAMALGGTYRSHLAARGGAIGVPVPVAIDQLQVDQAQILAEESAHDRRHAMHGAAFCIDTGQALEARTGKAGLHVSQQHRVDVADGHAELHLEEGPVPRRVEHAGHA